MRTTYFCALALALGFLLGIQDGRIALWKDGQAQPVEIFPIPANMLPAADQKALEEGITIENSSELNRILEDFLS